MEKLENGNKDNSICVLSNFLRTKQWELNLLTYNCFLTNLKDTQDFKKKCEKSKLEIQDFPSGPGVKNPHCNAGNTGWIPGPGRPHMPLDNKACTPQLLNLRSRARKPGLLSLCALTTEARPFRARGPRREKPPQ